MLEVVTELDDGEEEQWAGVLAVEDEEDDAGVSEH